MAKKSKRKKFTEEEIKLLLATPTTELSILSIRLGRDVDILRAKKWVLEHRQAYNTLCKSSKEKKRKNEKEKDHIKNLWNRWSKAEEELIMTSKQSDEELSKILGRTIASIVQKRNRLNADRKQKK